MNKHWRLGVSVLLLLISAMLLGCPGPGYAENGSIRIRKALFVQEAEGFGIYTKEEDNHFLSGSSTWVYLELENFSRQVSDEDFEIDLFVRLDVLDGEDRIKATSDRVFALGKNLKSQQQDLSFKVAMDFSKWKSGPYRLKFTAIDNSRNETHSVEVPLTIY